MRRQGRQIPRPRLFLVDNVMDNVTEIGINLLVLLPQLIFNFGNCAAHRFSLGYCSFDRWQRPSLHREMTAPRQWRPSFYRGENNFDGSPRELKQLPQASLLHIRRNYFQCIRTTRGSFFRTRFEFPPDVNSILKLNQAALAAAALI